MLKVATIVGTRPEIIRLSRVIAKLDQYFEHRLIHTGQNFDYELSQIFFDELGIRAPDHFLEAAGDTAAETIGQVIASADNWLASIQPDAVLILGDTNSSLAAIPAKRRQIPVFHMEAGNRCFDMRVPEEINRRIVDHVSDINLTYSQIARDYLLREGVQPETVIVTGSPMAEVLRYYWQQIEASTVLTRMGLEPNNYFLMSFHRQENVDDPQSLRRIIDIIGALRAKYALPVLVSTHPRTRARLLDLFSDFSDGVNFHSPFGFPDYVNLQTQARAVLSDSGTITEESSILNFPAINLRDVHERPEGFEEAAVMFTGLCPARVLLALEILQDQPRGDQRLLREVTDYQAPNVSEKIVRIILSYEGYVQRHVWRKDGFRCD